MEEARLNWKRHLRIHRYGGECWCKRMVTLVNGIKLHVSVEEDKSIALRSRMESLRSAMDLIHRNECYYMTCEASFLFFFIDILMKNSEDSLLLSDLLRIVPPSSEIRCFLLTEIKREMLDYVLYHSQKARFNLWGLLPFDTCETEQQNLMQEYLIEDSLEIISTIIKYHGSIEKAGFLHIKKWTYEGEISVVYLAPFRINWECKSRREMLMNQIVYFAKISNFKKRPPEQAKSCIKLIWSSLPDPYPTGDELRHHMATTCEEMEQLANSYSTSVSEVCDFFKETVSRKASERLQPRLLQQLSRCLIRQQLFKNTHLPGGIASLNLPNYLQEYVNLDV